jgi:hypothetical protein
MTTASLAEWASRIERAIAIATRASDATPEPWGYLRPSGVICASDGSDVAECLHDPDALFIAHAPEDILWLLQQLLVDCPPWSRSRGGSRCSKRHSVVPTTRWTGCPGRATGCGTWSLRARPRWRWWRRSTPLPAPWIPRASASRTAARERHRCEQVWVGPSAANQGVDGPTPSTRPGQSEGGGQPADLTHSHPWIGPHHDNHDQPTTPRHDETSSQRGGLAASRPARVGKRKATHNHPPDR